MALEKQKLEIKKDKFEMEKALKQQELMARLEMEKALKRGLNMATLYIQKQINFVEGLGKSFIKLHFKKSRIFKRKRKTIFL